MHANAYEATWKLDITPSEEELLKGMRKTTRYLIRQVQKIPQLRLKKAPIPKNKNIFSVKPIGR